MYKCAKKIEVFSRLCFYETRATESLATNPSSGTPATEGSRFRIGRRVGADTGEDLDGSKFFSYRVDFPSSLVMINYNYIFVILASA